MRPALTGTLLVALGLLSTPATSHAAKSYDNCTGFVDSVPAVITTQGVWCLRADLSTAITSGVAIQINTNNVTLDCNDFKLGGLAAGPATEARGIYSLQRSNVTITNCNVRGFFYGIHAAGGNGNRSLSNILDGNKVLGIWMSGYGATIRGNQVIATGGSTIEGDLTYGIVGGDGSDIIDNTVNGVFTISGAVREAVGIAVYQGFRTTITGNRVRGVVSINGTVSGILASAQRTHVHANQVLGAGTGAGIRCVNNTSTASDNVISGYPDSVVTCVSIGNRVNPN